MGLSAFNRAREIWAQLNEQNAQEEKSRLEEQWQADTAAAASVHDMIVGIDPESPDFAKMVISARTAHNALTPEQKKLVGNYAELEEAEAVLLEKLETPLPPAEPAQGAGDNTPPAETVPPAAEPEKPKKQGGSKK